ncbi:MAG: outer membrane protein [Parvicella sp.]|jgi:outer membrane protein
MLKNIFIGLFLLGFCTQYASAEKIGYVNAVKLVETAPQGKASLKKLESEFSDRENALIILRDEGVALKNETQKNSLLLSDSEKNDNARILADLERRLQREQRELNEDFNLRRNEELAQLQKIVTEAVIEVSKAEDYDIIFQQAVWFKPEIDITQKVLDYLTKQYSE